jgi:flavodoxin
MLNRRCAMKVLVVYDSVYGNTEQIARAIGGAITGDVRVIRAGEASPADLEGIDLLIVGAPTQGGRPSPTMQGFLKKVTEPDVKGMSVATFDTRISAKWVGIFGYAAGKIAKNLQKKGGNLVLNPEPFFVKGTKGPLNEGELERAAGWAQEVIKNTS